jgi:putative membrane protein
MAVAVDRIDRRFGTGTRHRDGVPVGLFLWTWLGSALAHSVFLGAPELRYSAIYGWLAMGILGVPLLVSLLRPRVRRPGTHDTHPHT